MKKVVCIENITLKRILSLNKEYEVIEAVTWLFNNNHHTFYKIKHNKNRKAWFCASFFMDSAEAAQF
jgi:hypothetical protein